MLLAAAGGLLGHASHWHVALGIAQASVGSPASETTSSKASASCPWPSASVFLSATTAEMMSLLRSAVSSTRLLLLS